MRIACTVLVAALTTFVASAAAVACPDSVAGPDLLCAQDDWGWEEDDSVKKPGPPPTEPEKPKETNPGGGWGSDSGGSGKKSGGDEWSSDEWKSSSTEPDPGKRSGEEASQSPEMRGKGSMFSIAVWFSGALPVGGQAGSGTDAPSWSEAFGFGAGFGFSAELRLLPCLCARFGIDYVSFPASDFTSLGTTNRFTNLSLCSFALGPRFYILTDRPVDKWFGPSDRPFKGFALFVGFDFGLAISAAVDWVDPQPAWKYWSNSLILSDNFAFGAEYRFSSAFGAFVEFGFGTMSAPSAAQGEASALKLNDAGSMLSFKTRIGLLVAF